MLSFTEIKVILKLPAHRAHKLYPEHTVSCFGLYSHHNAVICWHLMFDVSTLSCQLGHDGCRYERWSVWWKCIGHTGLLFCVCLTKEETFCLHVSWRCRMWQIEFSLLSNQNVFCNHWKRESVCVCVCVCNSYRKIQEYTLPDSVQQPHVQQPSTYAKPEAAGAVLGPW
jgi:hypothetical protein